MTLYRVRWEIDEEADTPAQAVRQARARQLDPDSIANVFEVEWKIADDFDSTTIDLSELNDPARMSVEAKVREMRDKVQAEIDECNVPGGEWLDEDCRYWDWESEAAGRESEAQRDTLNFVLALFEAERNPLT